MTTTITVEDMSCEHCERTVTDALQGVSGVTDVSVDGDADVSALVEAVEDAGYTAHA